MGINTPKKNRVDQTRSDQAPNLYSSERQDYRCGDTVYTSDVGDLERLRAGVPGFARVQIAPA